MSIIFKSTDLGARQKRFKSWLYHFIGCVTLGKLFNFSIPQCSHLQNRVDDISSSQGRSEDE